MARDFPGFFLYLYDHVFILFTLLLNRPGHVAKYGRVLYLCNDIPIMICFSGPLGNAPVFLYLCDAIFLYHNHIIFRSCCETRTVFCIFESSNCNIRVELVFPAPLRNVAGFYIFALSLYIS